MTSIFMATAHALAVAIAGSLCAWVVRVTHMSSSGSQDGRVPLFDDGGAVDDMTAAEVVAAVDRRVHPAMGAVHVDAAVRDRLLGFIRPLILRELVDMVRTDVWDLPVTWSAETAAWSALAAIYCDRWEAGSSNGNGQARSRKLAAAK